MDLKTWQGVVVFLTVIGAVITLVILRRDPTVIFELLVMAGVGGTLALTHSVNGRVNGNITQLTDLIRELSGKLANSTPIAPSDPPADPPAETKDDS